MDNQIQKYVSFTEIAKTAPALLEENKGRVERAVNFGESLLAKVQTTAMSAELDKEINGYLVKLKETLKYVKENRAPITQVLQTISKEFTECEQSLDQKRTDTTWFKLQTIRNDYAKELADETRKLEEAKQFEITKTQELEKLKASIQEHVYLKFNDLILNTKEGLRIIFNDLTLDEWNEGIELINGYKEEITLELYRTWIMVYQPVYISILERDTVMKDTMVGMMEQLNSDLAVEIATMKQELVSEYPAKKNELIALQEASKAEKNRLKKEQKEREKEQAQKLAEQKKISDQNAQNESIAKAQEAEMNTMFQAEQVEADRPKRTGYTIGVTSQLGYLPLMNFWFEKEGKSLPFDALERVTIGRIKKFCEVYAHKFDEKIQSPYLKYEEVFKQKVK